MRQAAAAANHEVFQRATTDQECVGMGTTLVAVIVTRGRAHIVHAGDSRAYLISSSSVRQLTMDHSMVQELLNRGDITREEAVNHPHKNIITRALGVQEMVDTDYTEIPFEEGETLIENVGYVVSTKYEGGITEGFGMKLLLGGIAKQEQDKNDNYYYTTGNKEFKVLYTTGKVRLNGKSAGDEELNEKVQPGMLISFSLNKAGELTKIDLLDAEAVEAERAFNPDIGAFGGAFYIDDKTVVVAVPEEDTTDEDDYFTKVTLDKSKKYTTRGYEIDPETKVAKFAVVTTSMKADIGGTITSDADIMVVTRVYEKAEDADNVYCRIEGYQSGKLVNLTVKSEANVYTIANGLRQGDVIYYSLNSQDLVDNIEKVESLMPKPGYFHKDERGANERVFGKLHTIKRDELSETTNSQQSEFVINLATEESADQELVKMVVDTKNEPPVYLLNSKTGKVSVITLDDLFSTEEVGYEKATELFVCKKKFDVKGIIAVK